ncbi:MAG TPA: divalent metal cation transporter, partial [Candidatus Cybelea sp.]|nr:divalent metal cation transporter [Candidatus Cybelea sp.]
PIFYCFYLAMIVVGVAAVIIPGAPLLGIIFYSQVLNGMLLPIILVLMLLLVNNKRLMGAWTNSRSFNAIAWATVVVVGALTLISTAQIVFPTLGG